MLADASAAVALPDSPAAICYLMHATSVPTISTQGRCSRMHGASCELLTGCMSCAGLQMVWGTGLSYTSTEGWLDFERPESDLRGSRGITVVRPGLGLAGNTPLMQAQ